MMPALGGIRNGWPRSMGDALGSLRWAYFSTGNGCRVQGPPTGTLG